MLVTQFFDPGIGHASYLVSDPESRVGFLVDPDRDIDRYLAAAREEAIQITHSFETHVHNDYVSGSAALARLRPITVVIGADAAVAYPHRPVSDGDVIRVGQLSVQCLGTPGHTPEHIAYLVADLERAPDPQYLFSGGALLVGGVARVDLFGEALRNGLARASYATVREKLLSLADFVAVLPTHGGGSACTGSVSGSRWSTLGFERRHNPVALAAARDFETFDSTLRTGLPVAPAYYPHVRALNAGGAGLADRLPIRVLVDPLPDAVLIDPRSPRAFGARHRRGALNVVANDDFGARCAAVVPFGTPIVVLTTSDEEAVMLRGRLAIVGFDDLLGSAAPTPRDPADAETIDQVEPDEVLDQLAAGVVLLDVREPSEFAAGHTQGAVHIPYEQIVSRIGELPRGRTFLTYCGGGIRSSLAASLLRREGMSVANLNGGFNSLKRAGVPIETLD